MYSTHSNAQRWLWCGCFCLISSSLQAKERTEAEDGRSHWAFQPIAMHKVPDVADRSWPLSDIDCFILNRLEREGLSPAKDADRYTWLRRVSFDLTGLPPTVEEIRDFQGDLSPLAVDNVVDRLLASRAFGERWARHWLDLVGYADQKGTSNSAFAEHAWRYRDYVVDAFNQDKPFDRFVREQIAGDLLPHESIEERATHLTATGFLLLGDLEIVEADKAKLHVDIVDKQVAKTGKAFLGMTLDCARCHDHKFDPIPQRDYYALGGFFHSTKSVHKTSRGVWSDLTVVELPETDLQKAERTERTQRHAERLAALEDDRSRVTKRKSELDELVKNSSGDATSGDAPRAERTKELQELTARIKKLAHEIRHAEFFAPSVPRVYGVRSAEHPADMRITIRGNPRALGDAVPRGFLQLASTTSPRLQEAESGRVQLADWIVSPDNPLTARVTVNRIWQKLFGEGLVKSVDYFGVLSQEPSHPELLDTLATRFLKNGWSQKRLIRSIVLSRAYRESSAHNAEAHAADPENRLLWRMNRQRLDAEALRDAMLAVSERLHPSPGGSAMPLEFPENVSNIDAPDNPPSFSFKKWRPEQAYQRTIYLPVVRDRPQPGPAELRNVFDFTQPAELAGQRSITAVPTQALFLMNSSVVKKHGKELAARVKKGAADNGERLTLLWLCALNRPITSEEKQEAEALLAASAGGDWTGLCHAIVASNEFLMRL
jgi:hypothetical protein